MDRRVFTSAVGNHVPSTNGSSTNAEVTGLQILKLLAYDPNFINGQLNAGQALNTDGFLVDFARDTQATQAGYPSTQFSADLEAGLTAGALAIGDWQFVDARNFASGLSVLTVRDSSGQLWVIPDGVDFSREGVADVGEALQIFSGGFNPSNSQQYTDFELYYSSVVAPNNATNAKVNLIGQSLGGALVLSAGLLHPERYGAVIAFDAPGLTPGLLRERELYLESNPDTRLPDIFEYRLETDGVPDYRYRDSSIQSLYDDGFFGGTYGGVYRDYVSNFDYGSFVWPPATEHRVFGLFESALFTDSPSGFSITREVRLPYGNLAGLPLFAPAVIEETIGPDGSITGRRLVHFGNLRRLGFNDDGSIQLTSFQSYANDSWSASAGSTDFLRMGFQLDGGHYELAMGSIGVGDGTGATDWNPFSYYRWRSNSSLRASNPSPVAVTILSGEQNGERIDKIVAQQSNPNQPGEAPIISNASLASIVGSNLVTALGVKDPFANIALRGLAGTLALNVGQEIDQALGNDLGVYGPKLPKQAFDDFMLDLGVSTAGAISSFLFAELTESLGIDGFAGESVNTIGGAVVSQIAENLVTSGTNIFQGVNVDLLGYAAGSFLGGYLARQLVEFDTIGGQIGSSIGSGLGGIVGGKVIGGWLSNIGWAAGPLGALAGAFLGYIVGGLIGSLFGGTPKASADLGFGDNRFVIAHSGSKNGGSEDSARSFADSVAGILNGVIEASGAHVADGSGIRAGSYEIKGGDFRYHESGGDDVTFKTSDAAELINHGSFIALSDLSDRLIGGDVYVKRALSATLEQAHGNANAPGYAAGRFDGQALLGNIATAQAYSSYLQNTSVISALIESDSKTAFSVEWIAKLAMAVDLGLDRRWKSDWLGGWAAFLDESSDGVLDGKGQPAGNLFLQLNLDTHERLFALVDKNSQLIGTLGDTIETESKDSILGTSSNDTITVTGATVQLSSNWKLNNAAAPSGGHKIDVAAYIDGGDGNDTIRGGDLGNDLVGGAGHDTLVGGKLDDWMLGGNGNDRIFAGAVSTIDFEIGDNAAERAAVAANAGNGDYLEGGVGNDQLYGGKGSDWLNGGDGIDRLLGGDGGDILQGARGNDRGANGGLFGGAGSDQYIFNYGDGDDVILDQSDPAFVTNGAHDRYVGLNAGTIRRNWAGNGDYEVDGSVVGGSDAIVFGAGIDMRDLVLRRSQTDGNDLIIELMATVNGVRGLTGDTLTIENWFDDARKVEWLRFANGEEIRIADISTFLIGTEDDDVIIGTYGADFMLGSDGNDQLWGLSGDDFGYGGAGEDFVAGDGDNDWVLGGDDDDHVTGGRGNDTVFGDGGNDSVFGGDGQDLIAGGRDADTVGGGAGDDVFRYERGDGADTMFDDYSDNWDLVWDGSVGNGGAYVNGYDLVGGRIVKNGHTFWQDGVWTGTYNWDDADNKLWRHRGADTNGRFTGDSGEDTLQFGLGIDFEDIQVRRVGVDLVLAISAGESDASSFNDISDRITLREWFSGGGGQIEKFAFIETGAHNVASWSIGSAFSTDGNDTLSGSNAVDWLTGGLGDDVISGGQNGDILAGNSGGDVLRGGLGADVLFGGADDDVLNGGAAADTLVGGTGFDVASYSTSGAHVRVSLNDASLNNGDATGDALIGIEGLEGSAFADNLRGNSSENSLAGLDGDDLLQGGLGDDTYVVAAGDGNDVIEDQDYFIQEILDENGELSGAFETTWTSLGMVNQGGVNFYAYRLIVTRRNNDEVVYRSRDGVDFLYATPQANAPSGRAWHFADGQWVTGAYRTGADVRTVVDRPKAGNAGNDTLELGVGVSLSDITAAWQYSGADLKLSFAGGGSVLIKDQVNSNHRVETLILADGLAANLTALKLAGDSATVEADLFLGGASGDSFAGGDGDDILSGGGGGDTLEGNDGDDTIEGGVGANEHLDGGSDRVSLHQNMEADRLYGDTLRYVGSNAGVNVDIDTNVVSGGHAEGDAIANFENVTGSQFDDTLTGNTLNNRLIGLKGNDTLEGGGGDDVLIGSAGHDTIRGGDGEDNIVGESGNDHIWGGAGIDIIAGGAGVDEIAGEDGNDVIDAGAGDDSLAGGLGDDSMGGGEGVDTLEGEGGDDKLDGGLGNDTLQGGAGRDTLSGGLGDDALEGGDGDDVYVFDSNSGGDTIIDAAGANSIVLSGVAFDKVWISRNGADLKIGVIGGTTRVTIQGYFSASSASQMHSITAQGQGEQPYTLYLGHAEALVTAMTGLGVATPSSMPASAAALLATYWHLNGKAVPVVSNQNLSTNEDVALTGSVGAVDHDDNTNLYEVAAAPAHGAVSINASTGDWTYTPAANYHGADSFQIRAIDGDGQSVLQDVAVTVISVNDAPHDIGLVNPAASIEERDRPQEGVTPTAITLATLTAADIDAPDAGDFDDFLFSVTDNRFEIFDGNVLRLKAGAGLNFEGGSFTLDVTVTDRNGAGLSFTKTFTIGLDGDQNADFVILDRDDYFYGAGLGDQLTGQAGRNIMFGLGGDDTINGAEADDDLDGGSDADHIYGHGGADMMLGRTGADWLEGGAGDDTIQGGDDVDHLLGGAGADVLQGDAGDDVIEGGAGADTMSGDAGSDTLDYSSSNGAVNVNLATRVASGGDAQGDVLVDDFENVVGSAYADTLTGSTRSEYIDGDTGSDLIQGGGGVDELQGGAGDDQIYGGADADEIHGGDGADLIFGGVGADLLYGDAGNDVIEAGEGGDLLEGGAGDDELHGGEDSDEYVIDLSSGQDKIFEFDADGLDRDKLHIKGATRSDLWFERVDDAGSKSATGNNLKISVLGRDASVMVMGWYSLASPPENRKIEFTVTQEFFTEDVDVEALEELMAPLSKPVDQASHLALQAANPTYASQWAEHWYLNTAPVIAPINIQTQYYEDVTIDIPISVVDDFSSASQLQYELTLYSDAARTNLVQTSTVISSMTVLGAEGGQTLRLTALQNLSGVYYASLVAKDLTDNASQAQNFTLNIRPVADFPGFNEGRPALGAVDGTGVQKATLGRVAGAAIGSWALNLGAFKTDETETLTIEIRNLPSELSLSAGTLSNGVWTVPGAQQNGLQIIGPATRAGSFTLSIRAISTESDGSQASPPQDKTLVVNFNARPTNITATVETPFYENVAGGLARLSTTDADIGEGGESFSYAFEQVNGVLQNAGGRFSITAGGVISAANGALLNWEANSSHNVSVVVADSGGLSFTKTLTINVTNVNERPFLAGITGGLEVQENLAADSAVKRLLNGQWVPMLAQDFYSDPDTITQFRDPRYVFVVNGVAQSIVNGWSTDAWGFYKMNATTGEIRTTMALDHEGFFYVPLAVENVTIRVTDMAGVIASGALSYDRTVNITITDVNERPDAPTVNVPNLIVRENQGMAPAPYSSALVNTYGNLIQFSAYDPEGDALQWEIAQNCEGYNYFIIGQDGRLYKKADLDYESGNTTIDLVLRVKDASHTQWSSTSFSVTVANLNELLEVTSVSAEYWNVSGNWLTDITMLCPDPDQNAQFRSTLSEARIVDITDITAGYSANLVGNQWQISGGSAYAAVMRDGTESANSAVFRAMKNGSGTIRYTMTVALTDSAGVTTYSSVRYLSYSSVAMAAPIIIDLDGDGIELVSREESTILFDMNATGHPSLTGWVGADDGILVFDRNGDGLIGDGGELAFRNDVSEAVSDLEGLRAYDSNGNGLFDSDDAMFGTFQVWRDANQDGVSQAEELSTLQQSGIAAINLTLNLTGQSIEGAADNVIYGMTEIVRTDGTIGAAGDVYLAYDKEEVSLEVLDEGLGQLPPVILDLNGDGVQLISRAQSNVEFDADNNGKLQRTGWFSAGDGVLALDRNGDGKISSGAEISFKRDVEGAISDLEGLAAYDSNANGIFDASDETFNKFRIWRDINQDGISQKREIKSLAGHHITGINLTGNLTGQSMDGATDNVVHATTQFIRDDGSMGVAADVVLAYEAPGVTSPPKGAPDVLRSASHQWAKQVGGVETPSLAALNGPSGDGMSEPASPRGKDLVTCYLGRPEKRPVQAGGGDFAEFIERGADAKRLNKDIYPTQMRGASALHQRLGVGDRRVLAMVNAMAGFNADRGSADLTHGRVRDPKVAELLTSIPSIRRSA
jgi:Ca2+-binding RTX toxin-like protein